VGVRVKAEVIFFEVREMTPPELPLASRLLAYCETEPGMKLAPSVPMNGVDGGAAPDVWGGGSAVAAGLLSATAEIWTAIG